MTEKDKEQQHKEEKEADVKAKAIAAAKAKAAAAAKAKAAALAKQAEKEAESQPDKEESADAKAKAAAAAKAKAAALAKQAEKEAGSQPDKEEPADAKAKAAAAAKAKAAAAAKAKAAALAKQGAKAEGTATDEKAKAIAAAKAKAAAAAKAKAAAAAKTSGASVPETGNTPEESKPSSENQPILDRYVKLIEIHLGNDALEESYINSMSKDVPTLVVNPDYYFKVAELFKHHEQLQFEYVSELHGTDYVTHMEVYVYLYSYALKQPAVLKVKLDRDHPVIQSLVPLWEGANWPECEAYDLLGIKFENHPDLKRILLGEEWIGHPLRKDYEPHDVEV